MEIQTVDVKTLKTWVKNNDAVIIDVREPDEHAVENIDGAILQPLGTITYDNLPPFSGKKLVIHCRSGKRSAHACQKILAENPDIEIYNLAGGIMAWSQENAIKSPESTQSLESQKILKMTPIPLGRQVQIVIGFCIFLSSFLTYAFDASFVFLTGFFGAGLVFAGITGFCGLGILLLKMPWNR